MLDSLLLADIPIGFWGQTLSSADIATILMLVLLEGMLSIDNALVLGLLAKRVPKPLQKRALTYGLVGAFVFRIIAVATASLLLRWTIVKLLGGGYLVYIAAKHLFFESTEEHCEVIAANESGEPELRDENTGEPLTPDQELEEIKERVPTPIPEQRIKAGRDFWMTVVVIELTDIAFAVDSILAALAFVGPHPHGDAATTPHPKLWVIIAGGLIGLMLMRVAAVMFVRLLEKFPRFETSAYLLVAVIGAKLLADWGFNSADHPHRVDFHDHTHPAFWVFWISMALCIAFGFTARKSSATESAE